LTDALFDLLYAIARTIVERLVAAPALCMLILVVCLLCSIGSRRGLI